MSYSRLDTKYILVKKGSDKAIKFSDWSDSYFTQNTEVWKAGEKTLLYRPLPDCYEEFEYPKDLAYTITLPDPISHNFEAQISSVQYTEYGECEIPES